MVDCNQCQVMIDWHGVGACLAGRWEGGLEINEYRWEGVRCLCNKRWIQEGWQVIITVEM